MRRARHIRPISRCFSKVSTKAAMLRVRHVAVPAQVSYWHFATGAALAVLTSAFKGSCGHTPRCSLGRENADQNGRRSALNGRKASSSGLRGCPWLRTACFVGLLGFSAAGVSVGSGAGAVNSEATGEAGPLDVASADGDSPPETASRRLGAPSLLGSSTAGGGGTTVEGAAAGAIASTTL